MDESGSVIQSLKLRFFDAFYGNTVEFRPIAFSSLDNRGMVCYNYLDGNGSCKAAFRVDFYGAVKVSTGILRHDKRVVRAKSL